MVLKVCHRLKVRSNTVYAPLSTTSVNFSVLNALLNTVLTFTSAEVFNLLTTTACQALTFYIDKAETYYKLYR